MAGSFGDSLGKKTVRELWNTPILRYLNENYGLRYRYLGLPGTELIDVKLWKDMIDEVVAFEMRQSATDEDPQGRRAINELRKNLRLLRLPSRTYFGPMEEVIILRNDYDGIEYKQERLVTIYNLDFCNEISSRVETREHGERVWRFEAIRQMLLDQQAFYKDNLTPNFFIILITVRNQIFSNKIKSFLDQVSDSNVKKYISDCAEVSPLPDGINLIGTHTWALKAFLFDIIQSYCSTPHISALFFPTIKYIGKSSSSPMLHFMVFAHFEDRELPKPTFLPNSFLNSIACASAKDDQCIVWEPEPGEESITDVEPSSVAFFQEYESTFF